MKATKAAATKKTPVRRKPAAAKAAPDSATEESPVPKTPGNAKQTQNNDMTPLPNIGPDSKLEQSPVEGTNEQIDVSMVTLETTKPLPIKKKVVRRVVKVVKKTPANAKVLSEQTSKTMIATKSKVEESSKEEELATENVGESIKKEEVTMKVENTKVESVVVSVKEEEGVEEPVLDSSKDDDAIGDLVWDSGTKKQTAVEERVKVSRNGEPDNAGKGEEVKEDEKKDLDDGVKPRNKAIKMEETLKDEIQREEAQPEQDEYGGDDGDEEYGDRVDFKDPNEDDFEDPDEPVEEADAMEDERRELTAVAKERKIKKEYEIFVGGLDRDATDEDLRKVFEKIGEVVEVRLHKDLSTNRNKGYAFVKFACKEHVKRALSEMKNPVIHGKRCGTAPSQDNDTLFLGNICNTWTKEAIRQRLKDFGVEGVENSTVVSDAQHEGRSRERTVKVAFAEPICEPDPEIMAHVKTIFLDGLPPHWDEDRVRECLRGYGEIVRIVLARNMSTAKRKDFGFVDFSTHEAAVACIEGINNREFGNGNTKETMLQEGVLGVVEIPPTRQISNVAGVSINEGMVKLVEWFLVRGRRGPFRGGYHTAGRGMATRPSRSNMNRAWHDIPERGHKDHVSSRRQPFSPEEIFDRCFVGRHFEEPYFYDDGPHGMKRPFHMTDQDPDYMEPSRLRPRLDYSDLAASFRGTHYRDSYGAGSDPYFHEISRSLITFHIHLIMGVTIHMAVATTIRHSQI
ncbi:hypothetical protein OIU84_006085 [Salix udensis]|uniref:RRM domain-containing protein n=1 Tax=Salix udensis TaxID=889485 RepID=A0AAD6P1T2_9ROSI|nr:hypothetical protein OIU84_006085 [Salix udensis]